MPDFKLSKLSEEVGENFHILYQTMGLPYTGEVIHYIGHEPSWVSTLSVGFCVGSSQI
jgi:hypothetical protein